MFLMLAAALLAQPADVASTGASAGAGAGAGRAFIVTCDCDTAVRRARIATAMRRHGARILYTYTELHGFAVAAPRRADRARFRRTLMRIPGIVAVQDDGMSQVSTAS